MMQEKTSKIKLIKILEILRQETDEDHYIDSTELMRRLEEQGICSNLGVVQEPLHFGQTRLSMDTRTYPLRVERRGRALLH